MQIFGFRSLVSHIWLDKSGSQK